MANAALEVFREPTEQEVGLSLRDRRVAIEESAIVWNSIKSLETHEGWTALVERIGDQIEYLKAQIVHAPSDKVDTLRGELTALQWLANAPSLAEAKLIFCKQVMDAHQQEENLYFDPSGRAQVHPA